MTDMILLETFGPEALYRIDHDQSDTSTADTIPPGHRLALRAPDNNFVRSKARGADLAQDLATITRLIALYNRRVASLSYAERVTNGLHSRIDLLRSYSETILGLATIPLPPEARGHHTPTSPAELRAEAKRLRMPAKMRWERFPPTNLEERRQMAKELSAAKLSPVAAAGYTTRNAAGKANPELTAYAKWLRRQAATEGKARSIHPTHLLSNPSWCADQKRRFDEIMSIDIDL